MGSVLLSALIVIALVAMMPIASAQTLDDQKAQAQRQVDQLQQKLEDSVERYNYACVKLEDTRGQIAQNKEQLTEAEQQLASNRTRLNSRVRAMYITRHYQFVDVVVSSKNLDQFLIGMDLAKKVSQKDAQLVKQVKDSKAQLEQARTSLQEQKSQQEAARREMADAKGAVEGDLSGAKGQLAGVEGQIRQAMERRAAQASTRSSSTGTVARRSADPVVRSRPPGAPHGGVVGVAYDQLGKPYVWGAAGPDSFDCSGLTMYCYSVGAGIEISHSSYAQAGCGTSVSVSELQPGDILGFRGWGHVGLFVGGDSFIHAPQSGDVVKVSSLSARTNFCGAVRP
jgi:cell wall-associated NlpC family hydrolase